LRQAIVLNALEGTSIEDVSFSNVHITYEGGGTLEEARREIPQVAGEYFEIGTPPAYGLYARNVHGLRMNDVQFDVLKADQRPAVVLDHVSRATMNLVAVQGNPQAAAAMRFVDSRGVLVTSPRVMGQASALLSVEGSGTADIVVDGGDLSTAGKTATFGGGAVQNSVRVRE